MSDTPFSRFVELIRFDKTVKMLQDSADELGREVALLDKEQASLKDQVVEARNQLNSAKKNVDEKELEMKMLDEMERQKEQHRDLVSNQKEYSSIEREIKALQKKQHELEDVLLGAWHMYESVMSDYEKVVNEHKDQQVILEKQREEKKDKAQLLQEEIEKLEQARQEKESGIPEEWLSKYSMMRQRVSDPVATVMRGSCSSCFHQVTAQDLSLIDKNKILTCKGCYRFLYKDPATMQNINNE